MQRAELETLTRQWISLWNPPLDYTLFDRLHADDFVDEAAVGRGTTRADYLGDLEGFLAAFPDIATRVEDLVIDEAAGKVAVRWSAVGTNALRFLGVGPTGERTRITGIEIVEFHAGRIVRRWGEWDISDHLAHGA